MTLLAFVDCETTGLNVEIDQLLEVGVVITGTDLRILHEYSVVIDPGPDALQLMSGFVAEMHTNNGLLHDIARGKAVPLHKAEQDLVAFLAKYVPKNASPMCGSTIGFDRKMLERSMPDFEDWFHYRSIDVSTVKELVKLWGTNAQHWPSSPDKSHRVLDDLHESIAELRHYKREFFTNPILDRNLRRVDL